MPVDPCASSRRRRSSRKRRRAFRAVAGAAVSTLAFAGIALWGAGCVDGAAAPVAAGDIVDSPGNPRVRRTHTPHYDISVIAGDDARPAEVERLAGDIGRWMEEGLVRYSMLAGVPAGRELLPVTVYLNRGAYDQVAARYGFPRRTTNGLTAYTGAVHVYYRATGGLDPAATLLHEGFHQYTHRALAWVAPQEVFTAYPGFRRSKLPTVPLWLEEGLAMVFETASDRPDPLVPEGQPPRVTGYNGPRMAQLQAMIRQGRCPRVEKLMRMKLGDPLTTDLYAAFWGLAYDLLRGGELREFPLGDFLRRAERLWDMNGGLALGLAMDGARAEERFLARWNDLMAERCLARFAEILANNSLTLEAWEEGWRSRILRAP